MVCQVDDGCFDFAAEERTDTSCDRSEIQAAAFAPKLDQEDLLSLRSTSSYQNESLPKWQEIEDRIVILLHNNRELIVLFQATHDFLCHHVGDAQSVILHFAALCCILHQKESGMGLSEDHVDRIVILEQMAPNFINSKISYAARLSLTRLLISVLLPYNLESNGESLVEEEWIEFLAFLTDATIYDIPRALDCSDSVVLLWELRAMCLRFQCHQQLLDERCRQIERAATVVAELISCSACLISTGIGKTTHVVTETLQAGGGLMKDFLAIDRGLQQHDVMDPRTRLVVCIYADSARRLSANAHVSAQKLVANVRDASSHGVELVLESWQEHEVAEYLVPNPKHRALLAAAGHVGIASIGAVAIVGEALLESTKVITQTTLSVTADVVQHKYGASAGQVVRDSSDTALNVVGTIAQTKKLAMAGTTITKAVAKKAGKEHVLRNLVDADESNRLSPTSVMLQSEDDSTVISVASFSNQDYQVTKRHQQEDATAATEDESDSEGEYLGTLFQKMYPQKAKAFATLPKEVSTENRNKFYQSDTS